MEGGILSVSQSVSPLRFGEGRQMKFCQSVSLSVPHIWRRMEDGILSVSQSVSSLIFGEGWQMEFCQSVSPSVPPIFRMEDGTENRSRKGGLVFSGNRETDRLTD